MSRYRKIKGISYSIAHKFSTSANHFAFMALHKSDCSLSIDLFSAEIKPLYYRKERNHILVGYCVDNFKCLINRFGLSDIQSAVMLVGFIPPLNFCAIGGESAQINLTIDVVDDRGRLHRLLYRESVLVQG